MFVCCSIYLRCGEMCCPCLFKTSGVQTVRDVCLSCLPFIRSHPSHINYKIINHYYYYYNHHQLSLLRPFTLDLKLIRFTNPFLHSLSGSICIAFSWTWTRLSGHWRFVLVYSFYKRPLFLLFFLLRVLD